MITPKTFRSLFARKPSERGADTDGTGGNDTPDRHPSTAEPPHPPGPVIGKYHHIIFLVALSLSVGVIGAVTIGGQVLWLDEAESYMWSSLPLDQLPQIASESNHTPAYYVVLKAWRWAGGDSELWMRMLSTLFVSAAVPFIYASGRVVGSPRVGLFAAAVFISSPFIFRFGQEARPYAMLAFVASVVMFCSIVAIKNHLVDEKSELRRDVLVMSGLAISTLLMTIIHHTAVLVPALLALAFLSVLPWVRRRYHYLIQLTTCGVLVAVVYAVFFLKYLLVSVGVFRYVDLGLYTIIHESVIVYGNRYFPFTAILLSAASVLALIQWYRTRDWPWALFLSIMCLGMPIAMVAIQELYAPVFKYRTLIWTLVPFSLIMGIGLASVRFHSNWLLAILLGANLVGIWYATNLTRQPMDQVVDAIRSEYQDGDAIVLCPYYYHKAFDYYWGNSPDSEGHVYGLRGSRYVPAPGGVEVSYKRNWNEVQGALTHDEMVRRHDRAWFILPRNYDCRNEHSGPVLTKTWRYGEASILRRFRGEALFNLELFHTP